MVVQIEGLRKEYGSVVALRDVDLEVEAGGIVGLLGPNGAGKTTLVEIVEGLRSATAGRISVLGFDPGSQSRELKERLGVQLQSTNLPADLTAAETLGLFSSFYRSARPVDEVLDEVGLLDSSRQRVGRMSGGQRQRIAIAIALIHDPDVVILDEPTAGLDPEARRRLHDLVRNLRSQGRTTVLTTHYIEEAEELCDRVVMIRRGEIVADGTPFELLRMARGRSTIWVAVDGELDAAPLIAAGAEPQEHAGEHLKFTTADPNAAVLALGDLLRSQRLTLVDLRLKRPTLEDVYLDLMTEDSESTP